MGSVEPAAGIEPPTCWLRNAIGPSVNVRQSRISKGCRDPWRSNR